jgi:hypothetical protein
VPESDFFNDTVPGWGTGALVGLVSAEVLSAANVTNSTTQAGAHVAPYTRLILKHDTLEDQTSRVSPDGHASLTFPSGRARASQYFLFAFYERLTHHRNLAVESVDMKTIFDNGSYVVDHFSAKGAETLINFWEEHILSDDLLALIAKVGNYGGS